MSVPSERRRSPRLTLEVPVSVMWHDQHGHLQEETTNTAIVNRHGALLYLTCALSLYEPVRLMNLHTDQVAFARVVWTGDTLADGKTRVGIEMTGPASYRFWGTLAVRLWEEQEQAAPPRWFARAWNWLRQLAP